MERDSSYPLSYAPVDDSPLRTVGADYAVVTPPGSSSTAPAPVLPGIPGGFVFPGTEDVNPAEVFAGPGYQSPRSPYSLAARLAILFGVLGVIPGVSLLAIAAGHYSLYEITHSRQSGRGLAVAGLTLGYMGAVLWGLFGIIYVMYS